MCLWVPRHVQQLAAAVDLAFQLLLLLLIGGLQEQRINSSGHQTGHGLVVQQISQQARGRHLQQTTEVLQAGYKAHKLVRDRPQVLQHLCKSIQPWPACALRLQLQEHVANNCTRLACS